MGSVAPISKAIKTPHLEVEGSCSLTGRIKISGAKNSALVLMAASLLTKDKVRLNNIPSLTDIDVMGEILIRMGIEINRDDNSLFINPKGLRDALLPNELVHSLRASFFCIGPLLARLGKAKIPLPGGCQIGLRPIDEHIKGLRALGAIVEIDENIISATIPSNKKRLQAANIVLDFPSVGATETILMAATLADGTTTIENAAREPEVQDLIEMLVMMGAQIKGSGSSKLTIKGVEKLNGCIHSAIPDRIEAGTFLIAAAITRSQLVVGPVIPAHLEVVLNKLQECGCLIEEIEKNLLRIIPTQIKAVNIKTKPFPGFPTDLQAPFMALMSTANGTSEITETIFENRMQHVYELIKMGASINLNERTAQIQGVEELTGKSLMGGDLRSTAAIVLASLAAKGLSTIEGLNHLDRGYESFETKLNSIGATISRIESHTSQNIVSACELGTHNKVVIKQNAA